MNPDIAETISDDIKFLAQGPAQNARRFSAYNINGFKFPTLSREQGSKTQNSGVFLISETSCIASNVDRCARQADLPYYGKLEDIIKLNYYGRFKVILFKCLWADTTRNRGYKIDAWKFNCVTFSKLIHTANMVYYVDDETDKEWSVAVHLKPRDLFEMEEVDEEDLYENEPYQQQEFGQFFDDDYENIQIAIEENMNE
ncbi:hypothetical protein R3W88_012714 [Solanum pinnatisectum]|uniref:DUF4216 domain-containing protein n=1 Tax=Solanum pinnatisectum TaxID=50273 RepID=A0AAV9L9T4_9SOLN|nr:hypothetical protein R3W88_012714 [Solanum pinnatisectum]